jgi:RHS repeat-associated protein
MAMSVVYTTINGVLYHENRGGVETEYVPDTLGSLIQCRDSSGNVTYTADYWPYGEVRTSTGSKTSPWGFVGLLGYFTDLTKRLYVRARHYRPNVGQWQTVDPLWPKAKPFSYVGCGPTRWTDPTGHWHWNCDRTQTPHLCEWFWNGLPYPKDPRVSTFIDCISGSQATCNYPTRFGTDPATALDEIINDRSGKPDFRVVYDGLSGPCASGRCAWTDIRSSPPTIHFCKNGIQEIGCPNPTCLIMHEMLHIPGMTHGPTNDTAWECLKEFGCPNDKPSEWIKR